MISQSKQQQQQNQSNHQYYHKDSSEEIDDNRSSISINQHDINLSNGINKDRLEQKPLTNGLTNDSLNNNTTIELVERYKQSIAPSNRAYHSTETIEEALRPPWALHYEVKRQIPQPNLPSNSTDMSTLEEAPRRLKSAPVVRSEPVATILTIPEPRFIIPLVPIIITNPVPLPSTPSRPKTRALSARARLNTLSTTENNPQQEKEIKSSTKKLSDEEIQDIFKRVYGDYIEQPPQQQPVQIIVTQPQPKPSQPQPIFVYKKAASWCGGSDVSSSTSSLSIRTSIETKPVQVNPHYRHRPSYIPVNNQEKKPILRGYSPLKKPSKHHRRDHYSPTKRNTPLLAKTPLQQRPRITLEINGIKLKFDPKLTLDDKSTNLTKYFIDERLYLIKDNRYNILDNVDPSILVKHNQNLTRSQPLKTSIEKMSSHSSPKHIQRSDNHTNRNFLSQNLNVNHMSLSKRPPTTTIYA